MKNILVLFLSVLLWGNLFSQQILTPEILNTLGRLSEVSISPDEKTLLYTVSWPDIEENTFNKYLYTQVLAPKETPILLDSAKVSNIAWHPSGKQIYYLASTDDNGTQLWLMNIDGTDKKQLTELENGINSFKFSPDMNWILFTQDVKIDNDIHDLYPDLPKADARIIDDLMYRHWDSWHDYKFEHLFASQFKNNKIEGVPNDLMKDVRYDVRQYSWNPDGKTIAYECKKLSGKDDAESTNTDIFIFNITSGKETNLTNGMLGYDTGFEYSPDGKSIAWLSMERNGYESDKNRLFVYNFEKKEKIYLTKNFDESVTQAKWSHDAKQLYFVAGVKATYQIHSLVIKTKEIKQLTSGDHDYRHFYYTKNTLIGKKMSMSSPYELFMVNPKNGTETQLTFINTEALSKLVMGKVEKRWIKTTDDKDMLTWVIYPPNFDASKTYPALLYCQGGPQSAVSQFFSFRWNFQMMAANDYIIVAPNRRGLPSFGTEWNESISGDWGGQAMKDYLSAIDEVAKEPYVNEDRLGAVGASYGGYSVYWLAGNHHKRFKAFISHCGLFNLESWYGTTEEMFFANFDIEGSYWDSPKPISYELFSPHNFVGNWDTPILVVHGQRDYRVPVTQGMEAFQAAQLRGVPSRFLYFPEEGHWVLKPQNGVLWQRVFFGWLEQYLKDEPNIKPN